MRLLLAVGLFVMLTLPTREGYRILGLFPLHSKSHMAMFEKLMRGLAEKGHEVDVLSHFPLKNPPEVYNDLSVRGTIPIPVNNISIPYIREAWGSYFSMVDYMVSTAGRDLCTVVLNSKTSRDLKNSNKRYDLIIPEIHGSDCMSGFAHHFKVPIVGIISSSDVPWGGERIGNPNNPAYIPNYFVSFLPRMSLMERLENTLTLFYAKLRYHFGSLIPSNEIVRKFFKDDSLDLQQLIYNFSLILVNSHFSANFPRPTVPNFVEVGGLHIASPQQLSKHFEDILNVPLQYKGVIYLSMGSMLLSENLPIYKLKALFEAFKQLPYRVLWKAARENMPKELDIPSNIYFEAWMPQIDILCHRKVKLFVSHGGLMGTQEAIYCGVPRLGIPFFADQTLNLKASEALGLAKMLDYNNITTKNVLSSINVLLGKEYRENAERVSQLFQDRPLTPLLTAIYWIEYVIRHNGAPHLKSVGVELAWYQYYLIDVTAIIIFVLLLIFAVIYYALRFVLNRMIEFRYYVKPKRD